MLLARARPAAGAGAARCTPTMFLSRGRRVLRPPRVTRVASLCALTMLTCCLRLAFIPSAAGQPASSAPNAAPPPPPAVSLEKMKLKAVERVLNVPRFLKKADECYFIMRKPPHIRAPENRYFLLPPGKTWGNLPFQPYNLTDEDFYSLSTTDPTPRGPDELIIDFELVTTPEGSNVTTDNITMISLAGDFKATQFRVVPAGDFAVVPDEESKQWKAINRTAPEHVNDIVMTMATAPNVSVVMLPDTHGTYQMLITVVDACNSTAQVVSNVTVLCAHYPAPRLANGTAGDQVWDQKAAMAEVSETHSLGWWPAHNLDASPTYLIDVGEQYFYAYRAAYELKLLGEAGLIALAAAQDKAKAAADAASQGLTNLGFLPQVNQPPAPPPPTHRPLADLDGPERWVQWTTAPRWHEPFRESDGLLYNWQLTGAPHGSNAWRRLFKGENDTAKVVRLSADGYPYLHASAPSTGKTPFVDDPRNFIAKFQPDVVGEYDFKLDVGNVCFGASLTFKVRFVCNAVPQPSLKVAPEDVGLCLARQDVTSTTVDDDGDDVHVLWASAPVTAEENPRKFPDGSHLGARNASYGLLLSDHTGPTTSFMPDVQGQYMVRLTATDGCLITARDLPVEVEWLPKCTALATFSSRILTLCPLGALFMMLALAWLIVRRTPLHPYNPLAVRADAVRLQRWEAFKLRVKFERLRESWTMKNFREDLTRAIQEDGRVDFSKLGGPGAKKGKVVAKGATVTMAQHAFEAAILAAATEEGSELIPSSVHVWRMGQAVAIAAEGLTLASLAFAHNTWWGPGIGLAGRSLGLILATPGAYAMANFSAMLLVCAFVVPQLAKPLKGRRAPAMQRLMRATHRLLAAPFKKRPPLSAQEMAIQKQAAKYAALQGGGGNKGKKGKPGVAPPTPAFFAAPTPARTPGASWSTPGRPLTPAVAGLHPTEPGRYARGGAAAAMALGEAPKSPARAKSPARTARLLPGGGSHPGTPMALRPPPAWAVSPGRQWSVSPGRSPVEMAQRAAAAAAARERADQRWRERLRRVLGGVSFLVVIVQRVVHFLGGFEIFVLYLVAEPLFIPLVAASAAMLTCNHTDAHRPFPHLARDDTLRCYGPEHLPLMAAGAATALAALPLAAWFLIRVAPRQDLASRELPHSAVIRTAVRWFAAAFSIAQGEVEMTRESPRGAYGVPSGEHAGWTPTMHSGNDAAHLTLLFLACVGLYAYNFTHQPVRGRGALGANAARGAAYAGAAWAATMGLKVTLLSSPPPGGGSVSTATEIADAVALLVALPLFCVMGWRHTARRGALFCYPDESPHRMRRHDDPRVRAMGVLVGNASDGLVGAFGHWEGLDRQKENEVMEMEMATGGDDPRGRVHVSAAEGVDHTPGEGLVGLTQEAQDDVAEDALTWQMVLQAHFAGFGVGLNVRVHACQVISALARSERGVMCVQRACLVPLLKRLLLDPEESAVRVAAAEAVAQLAHSKRGVALLCQEDHNLFLASQRQRHREWFEGLIHLERKYGRHALHSDVARVMYAAGFWQAYATDHLPPEMFAPLLDWHVKPWLDDGTGKGLDGDGSQMGGGFTGGELIAGFDEAAQKKQMKKDQREAEKRRRAAEEAAKNAGGPEMGTPEALARLLHDPEDVVVMAAVRAIGSLFEGLRGANGRKMPQEAEKTMLHNARALAKGLFRTDGLVKPRALPEEGEDEDDALNATVDTGGWGGDLGRESGSSVASSRSGSTYSGSSRTSGSRSTRSAKTAFDPALDSGLASRKPSPMDHALDAPGLLEGMLLTTAHDSPMVRSAALEELVEAAKADGVATIAKRVLGTLEGSNVTVRVKSLEWVAMMVASRLKELTEAALDTGRDRSRSRRSGRSTYTETDPFFAEQRFGDLARESVDLTAGIDAAPPETPCVTTVLSQDGVCAVTACLDDMDSAAVRIAALQLLRGVWEVLAADEGGEEERDEDTGRLALFRECGVLAKLEALRRDDPDPSVANQTASLVQRILETDRGAPVELRAAEQQRETAAADRREELLEAARGRREREEIPPTSPSRSGWSTDRSGSTTWRSSRYTTTGGGGTTTEYTSLTSRTGLSGTETGTGYLYTDDGTSTAGDTEYTGDDAATSEFGAASPGERLPPDDDIPAARWDDYVHANAPVTVRFLRGVPAGDETKEEEREEAKAKAAGVSASGAGNGRTSTSGLGRWAPFVATGDVATKAARRAGRRTRGGAVVRARLPVRTMDLPGAPAPPVRGSRGEPDGPGPQREARSADQAAHGPGPKPPGAPPVVDPFRPTWRERVSEYILAGGGSHPGPGGNKRRGPHERGVIRDGQMGAAGVAGGRPEGPNEMFPAAGIKWGPFNPERPIDWGRREPLDRGKRRGRLAGRAGGGVGTAVTDPASDDHGLGGMSGDSALEREHMTERGRERIRRDERGRSRR